MESEQDLDLPPRIFAAGEEPNGERVNSYLKANRIGSILNALEDDEVREIRESPFGKLIATAEKPSFSGAFGQYIITRMLSVKKKHEIWFLFAGWPIRVSLREFAIVTGLPCGKLPKQSKKKKRKLVVDKKYWGELFGCFESLTVDKVIKLLKKRIVTDRKRRIKYAYLALTSSVLCPSSHFPKIIDEHVELIRDLEYFLSYPWGRVSFEMVVASIKSKDEVALSQKSVAVQGFFHAFQLVMLEAVPEILEVVEVGQSSSSSESESDFEDETRERFRDSLGEVNQQLGSEHNIEEPAVHTVDEGTASTKRTTTQKVSLSPGHARDVDEKCESFVRCIIPAEVGVMLDESQFVWSDDEDDEPLNNMLRLIREGFHFEKKHFKGGLTSADIERIRVQRKEAKEAKENKDKGKDKEKSSQGNALGPCFDQEQFAEIVASKVKAEFQLLEGNVSSSLSLIRGEVAGASRTLDDHLELAMKRVEDYLKDVVSKLLEGTQHVPANISVTPKRGAVASGNDASRCRNEHKTTGVDNTVNNGALSSPNTVINGVLQDIHTLIPEDAQNGEVRGFTHRDSEDIHTSMPEDADNGETQGFTRGDSEMGDNLEVGRHLMNDVPDQVNDPAIACHSPLKTTDVVGGADDVAQQNLRKSKRLRSQSSALQGFDCSVAVNQRASFQPVVQGVFPDVNYDEKYASLLHKLKTVRLLNITNETQISSKDVLEIAERTKVLSPKVVDALVYFSRLLFMRAVPGQQSTKIRFFDTKFIAGFMKHYPRFSKLAAKDRGRFVFQESVMQMIRPVFASPPYPERFYFPFFVDKSHWVGVCVDLSTRSIQVLDCNTPLRSDSLMKRDLTPVAVMLPYLIKAVSSDTMSSSDSSFSLDRARGVPHNPVPQDSAVTTMLLIGAHSMVGYDGCKCITPEVLPLESKRLAVVFFQEFGGTV